MTDRDVKGMAAGRLGVVECTTPECDRDFLRAAGDVLCSCGKPYRSHPFCAPSWCDWAEHYALHVLCDGRHVKL